MTDTPPQASSAEPSEEEQPRGFWRGLLAGVREVVIIVVMAMVLSLVIKTWIAQAFFIPSGSMKDTLQVGDRVMVSKLHKQFAGIQRGDVVVFRDPGGWLPPSASAQPRGQVVEAVQSALTFVGLLPDPADEHLIKRVVGTGGDHVVCCDPQGRITVNGAPISEPYIHPGDAPSSLTFDIRVPEEAVWVMGDHRSDSQDSRYHPLGGDGDAGSVSRDLIVGRALLTVWPLRNAGVLSNHPAPFAGVPAP